jgi:hypothetical protein
MGNPTVMEQYHAKAVTGNLTLGKSGEFDVEIEE